MALSFLATTAILLSAWTGAVASSSFKAVVASTKSTSSSLTPDQLRRLQQNNNNDDANNNYVENFAFDLSSYSVRYEKCQYVRAYDDDMAADENSDGPLAMKHFVLFRLCPSDDCDKCENGPYGKYVTDVDTYLAYTVQQQKQIFENMCNNCEENCGDDNNGDCSSDGCGQLCNLYGDNMEANGLIDASNYVECQQLEIPENDDDANNNGRKLRKYTVTRRVKTRRRRRRRLQENDDEDGEQEDQEEDAEQQQEEEGADEEGADEEGAEDDIEEEEVEEEEQQYIYIGPRCSSGDRKIVIGLFSDANCWEPYEDESVEDLLGAELSYYFLEHTFTSGSETSKNSNRVCLTCAENDQNANQNDKDDADRVNEMCEDLYDAAAKCESPTGITAGFIQTKRDNDEYENQVENEFLSCAFIDSLLWNSYTETGEIDYTSRQDVYVRVVTKLQAISLEVIAGCFVILLAMVHYFQKKIAATKGAATLHADARAIWA
ncbi:hypothetical protein ACA910_012825 [Epithemia clementina (nom. ined.)]